MSNDMTANHITGLSVGKTYTSKNAAIMGFFWAGNANDTSYGFLGGHSSNNTLVWTMGGNVGIGTTTPSATLHVAGDLKVDGNIHHEASADVDFRVESNGNANMLFVDGGNDRVGIGTASPSSPLGSLTIDPHQIIGHLF